MRRITSRFVLLIGTAAVLPLVVYGFVSITSLRNGTGTSVREGNRRVAEQVAEQVTMYMQHNTRVLQSVGIGTERHRARHLAAGADSQGLRPVSSPSSARSPLFDAAGPSGRDQRDRHDQADGAGRGAAPRRIAPTSRRCSVDDDLLPTTTIAVRLSKSEQDAGWIVGEIALEELWRMVDRDPRRRAAATR